MPNIETDQHTGTGSETFDASSKVAAQAEAYSSVVSTYSADKAVPSPSETELAELQGVRNKLTTGTPEKIEPKPDKESLPYEEVSIEEFRGRFSKTKTQEDLDDLNPVIKEQEANLVFKHKNGLISDEEYESSKAEWGNARRRISSARLNIMRRDQKPITPMWMLRQDLKAVGDFFKRNFTRRG